MRVAWDTCHCPHWAKGRRSTHSPFCWTSLEEPRAAHRRQEGVWQHISCRGCRRLGHVNRLLRSAGSPRPVTQWRPPVWAQRRGPREQSALTEPTCSSDEGSRSLSKVTWSHVQRPQKKPILVPSSPCGSPHQFFLPFSWCREGRRKQSREDPRHPKETLRMHDGSRGWPSPRCPWHGCSACSLFTEFQRRACPWERPNTNGTLHAKSFPGNQSQSFQLWVGRVSNPSSR